MSNDEMKQQMAGAQFASDSHLRTVEAQHKLIGEQRECIAGLQASVCRLQAELATPAPILSGEVAELRKLANEARSVFDSMLTGCALQEFGDYQNGEGETIGPRMDALHAALRALAAVPAMPARPQHSSTASQPTVHSRLMEMSEITRRNVRWSGNEHEFGVISATDAAMLDDLLGDALLLLNTPAMPAQVQQPGENSEATRLVCLEAAQKLRTYVSIYTGDKQARRLVDELSNIADALATPAQPIADVSAASDERAAFEVEMRKKYGEEHFFKRTTDFDGLCYDSTAMNGAWNGWRAARTTPASGQAAQSQAVDTDIELGYFEHYAALNADFCPVNTNFIWKLPQSQRHIIPQHFKVRIPEVETWRGRTNPPAPPVRALTDADIERLCSDIYPQDHGGSRGHSYDRAIARAIERHITGQADSAAERDAARYRWLRDRPEHPDNAGIDVAMWENCEGQALRGESLDAAMQPKGKV